VIEDTASKGLFYSLRSRCVGNHCNCCGNHIYCSVCVYSVRLGTCVVSRYLVVAVFSHFTAGTMFPQPLAGNGCLLRLRYSAFSSHVTVFIFLQLKAIVDIISLMYDIYINCPSILKSVRSVTDILLQLLSIAEVFSVNPYLDGSLSSVF
jgi:hypothetical protein